MSASAKHYFVNYSSAVRFVPRLFCPCQKGTLPDTTSLANTPSKTPRQRLHSKPVLDFE
jgi:hypothetical protein